MINYIQLPIVLRTNGIRWLGNRILSTFTRCIRTLHLIEQFVFIVLHQIMWQLSSTVSIGFSICSSGESHLLLTVSDFNNSLINNDQPHHHPGIRTKITHIPQRFLFSDAGRQYISAFRSVRTHIMNNDDTRPTRPKPTHTHTHTHGDPIARTGRQTMIL